MEDEQQGNPEDRLEAASRELLAQIAQVYGILERFSRSTGRIPPSVAELESRIASIRIEPVMNRIGAHWPLSIPDEDRAREYEQERFILAQMAQRLHAEARAMYAASAIDDLRRMENVASGTHHLHAIPRRQDTSQYVITRTRSRTHFHRK